MSEAHETILQLNSARAIVLKDAAIYPQVVPGVLPVIGPERPLPLRRWGSDFLAETFASPALDDKSKQSLALQVLDTLQSYLGRKEQQGEEEDPSVVKSAVQCAASIYPLVFRHVVENASEEEVWKKMAAIKSSILRRMDTAPGGVRICCIKFVARVVQVQTAGVITDPRRPEQNEVSLALVSREHKVLPYSNLEAEASGMLDRLLGVLQEQVFDPLIVTATLNSLAALVQKRPSIATKILSTVLSFNPLAMFRQATLDGKDKVAMKSMTRTTTAFLLNTLKRAPQHPLAGRLQQQIERLRQNLTEVLSGKANPLKRGAPDEPTDGLSDEKRQRLDQEASRGAAPAQYPPLPPGPVSLAQLFTLTNDRGAAGFHVEAIPAHVVHQLVPPLLASIQQQAFDTAANAVRSRILEIQRRPPPPMDTGEEDDDYDPLAETGYGDREQMANQLDVLPPMGMEGVNAELPASNFRLPTPPPLSPREVQEYSETAKDRLFSTLRELDASASKTKKTEKEKGFTRLASAGHQDREGWIALLTRLATRSTFPQSSSGLDDDKHIKKEDSTAVAKRGSQGQDLPTKLRQAFTTYILDDWRRQLDVAIAWLNEEWYCDTLAAKTHATATDLPNYTSHTLSLLDALLPYIDMKDTRHVIRFLSEIPHLPSEPDGGVWSRIEKLAADPERLALASQVLLYLVMFRPPVRDEALGCAIRVWRGDNAARGVFGKWLGKWRPDILEEQEEVKKEEG